MTWMLFDGVLRAAERAEIAPPAPVATADRRASGLNDALSTARLRTFDANASADETASGPTACSLRLMNRLGAEPGTHLMIGDTTHDRPPRTLCGEPRGEKATARTNPRRWQVCPAPRRAQRRRASRLAGDHG